jgi:hypothetical protein
MHIRKQFTVLSALILMSALMLVVPAVRADEWNQSTKLTFNQPMEIPGHKILAAGTYWFATLADLSAANMVQILNADRSRIVATLQTVPIQRAQATPRTEINLAKPQGNEPNVLVSWFYPDSHTGHEFVYSRQEERTVASEPVIKVMASPAAISYGD